MTAAKEDINTRTLLISPQEALIIDGGFKAWITCEEEQKYIKELLGKLAAPITTGQPVRLAFSEYELWLLRNHIDATRKVGQVSGQDLLLKIYAALLEIADENNTLKLPAWMNLPVKDTAIAVEITETETLVLEVQDDASGSTRESPTENPTEVPT